MFSRDGDIEEACMDQDKAWRQKEGMERKEGRKVGSRRAKTHKGSKGIKKREKKLYWKKENEAGKKKQCALRKMK